MWTVRVIDAGHSGSRSQPYAIAVSGVGVNDLRPDPSPIVASFSKDIAIPQVGDEVLVEMKVSNLENVEAESVEVIFQEEGLFIDSQTFGLAQVVQKFYSGIGILKMQEVEHRLSS